MRNEDKMMIFQAMAGPPWALLAFVNVTLGAACLIVQAIGLAGIIHIHRNT